MGSRSKVDLAYIAGFLDGDGSLMLQIKKRKDGNRPRKRFMTTMVFYQDSRHEKPLFWIRKILNIGHISRRKDSITELRIQGYRQIEKIVSSLLPFIKFKRIQAKILVQSARLLQKRSLKANDWRRLVDKIIRIQNENYVTKRKRNKRELLTALGLTP